LSFFVLVYTLISLFCAFYLQNKESFRSTLHDSLFHVLTLTDPKLDVGPALDPQNLTNVLVVHLDLLASMFHVRQSTANPVRENAWDAICKLYAELDLNPGYWTSLRAQLAPLVCVEIELGNAPVFLKYLFLLYIYLMNLKKISFTLISEGRRFLLIFFILNMYFQYPLSRISLLMSSFHLRKNFPL
jgi:hypothetical protein